MGAIIGVQVKGLDGPGSAEGRGGRRRLTFVQDSSRAARLSVNKGPALSGIARASRTPLYVLAMALLYSA